MTPDVAKLAQEAAEKIYIEFLCDDPHDDVGQSYVRLAMPAIQSAIDNATAALRVGVESADREIRYRSSKLLARAAEIDLQLRFERFKNDTDPEQDYGLPGWDAYREVVGDSLVARSIFVSMHEDEARLLGQIDDSPARLADALANRCDQCRNQAIFERVPVRLGTIATL